MILHHRLSSKSAAHLFSSLVAASLPILFLAVTGCSTTPPTTPVTKPTTKKVAKTKVARVTSIRDPLVREEIREELNDLKSLSDARQNLRDSFKAEPLKGPLTMARLEDVLVAEYRANALQQAFAQRSLAEAHSSELKVEVDVAPKGAKTEARQKKNAEVAQKKPESVSTDKVASTGHKTEQASAPLHDPVPAAIAGIPIPSVPPSIKAVDRPSGIPASAAHATFEPGLGLKATIETPATILKKLSSLENSAVELSSSSETPLIFDIPVTYNARVSFWIKYFQTSGRASFRTWLERSARFLPILQYELARAGMPQDLVYVPMIESGFSPSAVSHASAMGLWQFIVPTGKRYGLRVDWWIDERKDFLKSTRAAIGYMTDLYRQFNSWYLVAASYNMGENGVRRLIKKHGTNNFWELADRGALPTETKNYVPKIIAAMLISKAPALYGFRDLTYHMPMAFEYYLVPGGTDLVNLARHLGVSEKYLKELNPELIKGFVPRHVSGHKIRIPKGSMMTVSQYVRLQTGEEAAN